MFLIIGLIFLPFTFYLFNNFFDKGYAFSKIIGIIFITYTVWLLGSLKLVHFNQINILLIIFSFLLLNLIIVKKISFFRKFTFSKILKDNRKIFFTEEIIFMAGLFTWSFIKAHEPSIYGLEKYMDFGFLNSILRSDFFPPKDLWMSPESINYYYFGHLIMATLTKISQLDSAVTFNLMLSSVFALTLSASFSLGANIYAFFRKNIKEVLLSGSLTAFLVTMSGNLQTIYAFFSNYPTGNPIPFWQLNPMFNFAGYWYANATRFIPLTIHEFPLYSFVVSDLHGHVLNIPAVLLIIAIITGVFYQTATQPFHFRSKEVIYFLFLGFLVSVAAMSNVLDGPIYVMLIGLILLFKKIQKPAFSFRRRELIQLSIVILSAVVFSLPFLATFKPFTSGIGIICPPDLLMKIGSIGPFVFEDNHCQRSPFWMLGIVYGFFFIVLFGYLLIVKPIIDKNQTSRSDYLALILMLFSTIAILIPEIIYFRDIYTTQYRANTVFKFGYQAFIVASITAGFFITRIIMLKKHSLIKNIYSPILIVLLFLISLYPYFAVSSYFKDLKIYRGLNGLAYLQDLYPSDYQAILYIRENIKGQPVILEADGASYSDFARISANTGLPTVIGWPDHEWLWRGNLNEVNLRRSDVEIIYKSANTDLIAKYNISYVFIGTLERQTYPDLDEGKFKALGKEVYRSGQTVIYLLTSPSIFQKSRELVI